MSRLILHRPPLLFWMCATMISAHFTPVVEALEKNLYSHQELLAAQTDTSSLTESGSNTWQYLLLGLSGVFIIVAVIMCCQLYRTRHGASLLPLDATSRAMPTSSTGHPDAMTEHVATVSTLEHIFPAHVYHPYCTPLSSTVTTSTNDCEKNLKHLLQESSYQTCIICLEEFVPDVSLVRSLPCQHMYHAACIGKSTSYDTSRLKRFPDRWLTTRSNLCPLCKTVCVNTQSAASTDEIVTQPSSTRATTAVTQPADETAHPPTALSQPQGPIVTVIERGAETSARPELYRLIF